MTDHVSFLGLEQFESSDSGSLDDLYTLHAYFGLLKRKSEMTSFSAGLCSWRISKIDCYGSRILLHYLLCARSM